MTNTKNSNAPTLKTEAVPLDSLTPWPGNARRGVVSGVKESMMVNGVFQPLIVQKSTRKIIAGNHRWQALVELHGEQPDKFGPTVDVIMIDVNDTRASKMNLADNKTSDDATWDNQALLDQLLLLDGDDDLTGTGFADDDLSDLQALMENDLTLDDFQTGGDEDGPEDAGAAGVESTGITDDGSRMNDEQRIMILNLPVAAFTWLDDQLIDLSEEYGTDSNTWTIITAIERLTGNACPVHQDDHAEGAA
ncbi:ParB/RepB/Spo0J family partition protein [Brevibacterium moorei]|uniref:ParB/RepB/Spo0J family partition protein n=1 Tax=Brevibacterium moorei TaxID=2968457 RepID=UPI00211C1348|nr:ParB/RepB/Spo0J family partition protein [Brevibacterium sp. 68QC2CO]